jgi:hypothetical protein
VERFPQERAADFRSVGETFPAAAHCVDIDKIGIDRFGMFDPRRRRMTMAGSPVASVLGLVSLVLISACTVVVDDPVPVRPGPPPPQQFCPRVYDPVCGRAGPDRQTFGNACEANAAGYRVQYPGQCRRGGAGPRPEPAPPPGQRFCTRQYEPVCARRGNNVRSFGNACEARNANYRILYDAPCR